MCAYYYINHSMVKKLLNVVVNIPPSEATKNLNNVVRFIYTEKNWLLYQAPPPASMGLNCNQCNLKKPDALTKL